MRCAFVAIICIAAAGCDAVKPKMSDAQMQQIRAAAPGLTEECLRKIRWGGIEALTGEPEDCYKFDAPRRWTGLWFGEFETSRFCPEPAADCSNDSAGERIWLRPGKSVQIPPWNGDVSPALFRVDFVGRKTAYRGNYGHVGGSEQEIVIDRLISMKRIPTPEG